MEEISIAGEFIATSGPKRDRPRIRSHTISTRAGSPLSSLKGRTSAAISLSKEWEEMPNFHDQNTLHDWWTKQQGRRQSEAEAESPGTDAIEPPFPLDVLTILLLENPDLYAVVDQIATDVAGLGWMIRDKKDIGDVEAGAEGSPAVDSEAAKQRLEAEAFFKTAPADFDELTMDLENMLKCEVFDKKGTGNGYIEVSSTSVKTVDLDGNVQFADVKPAGMFHVPSRLMRRLKHGRGWKQIDDQGRDVAVFRDWGSDPNAPSSVVSAEESQRYRKAKAGELKNEIKAFKEYHSAEAHYGVPAVISALRSVFGTIYAENRNLRFFINRGVPDWLIEVKADSDDLADDSEVRDIIDENIETIGEHMRYMLMGEDHRTLINEIPRDRVEMTWSRLTQPVEDQDFPTYRIDNRDTTIRVYRVPPSRLSIVETANLGTGSGQTQAETYKTSIVDPEQRELENFLNEVVAALGLHLVEFKFLEMDVLDELRQAQIFQVYWVAGIMSINEGRRFASLYLKDMELPDLDEDLADIPVKMAEFQGLGAPAAGGFGGGQFGGMSLPSGSLPALPEGQVGERNRRLEVDPSYRHIHRDLQRGLAELRGGGNGGRQGAEVKGTEVGAATE